MKKIFSFLCFIILAQGAPAEGPEHDGNWWLRLSRDQKITWSVGWWDGIMVGSRLLGGTHANDTVIVYEIAIHQIDGVSETQLVQGIDQFYAADFRNLSIKTNDAALLVTMYVNGLTAEQAGKLAAELRDVYINGSRLFDR